MSPLAKNIAGLREDLFNHFASKEFFERKISDVERKISESKFKIILWAFVFCITQLGAIFIGNVVKNGAFL